MILVTAQLLVFGYYRYAHSNYYSDNRIGFSHLFLGDAWDPVREIDTYPPSTGALALYEKVSQSLKANVLILVTPIGYILIMQMLIWILIYITGEIL